MKFFKLQAAGNDFIFITDSAFVPQPQRIRQLCDRHFGIGSDGLVILSQQKDNQYQWTFFNPDGGEAEMCGNAARAAVQLLFESAGQREVFVKTRAGVFRGEVPSKGELFIEITIPSTQPQKIENPFGGRFNHGHLTNTGVPHFVMALQQLSDVQSRAEELSPFIWDKAFAPQGANLTFYAVKAPGVLDAVTLERGVNHFTLSCGTGVMAAAQIYNLMQDHTGGVRVNTPGGTLHVEFLSLNKVKLSGPAQIVFEGSFQ